MQKIFGVKLSSNLTDLEDQLNAGAQLRNGPLRTVEGNAHEQEAALAQLAAELGIIYGL